MRAMRSLWNYKSSIGLLGSHINITSGSWINTGSTIGSGVDSFFEYLVKGSILFRTPELDMMFREYKQSIEKYMRHGDWHFIVQKETGRTFQPFFQGLDAFWPGVLVSYTRDDHPSLVHHVATGDIDGALRHLTAYHEVWKKYGFIPEVYNPLTDTVDLQNSAYLLRPEFIESIYHVYRATKDPLLIKMGAEVLTSIEKSARTKCGYASVADVHTHKLDNRMESFFLSETIKYLYLLFDEDNFINQLPGESPLEAVKMTSGQYCYPGSGGYVFNTEAHPIDPGALKCCDARWLREQDRIDWVEDGQSTEKSQLELVENLLEQFNPMVEIVQNGIDKVFDEAPLSIQRLLDDAGARNLSTSQLYCDPTDQYSIESLTDVRRFLNHLTNLPIEGVDNTVAELSSLSGKVDESKLLSCPYPEFHQRFTYGGQLATPLK